VSSCDDVQDLLPEVLPHLPPLALRARALEVQEHLKLCPSCAESAEELARVVTALTTEAAPAPALSADFADRVLDALPRTPADHLREVSPTLARLAAAVAIFAGGFGAAAWSQPEPATRVVYRDAPRTNIAPAPAPPAPAFQPARQEMPAVQRLTAAPAGRARHDGLERYVTEANLVLEAVTALDRPDPHWMQVISRHVDEAALLAQGEHLLVELSRAPDRAEARALRPLINATQVVLRKVRHAPEKDDAATLTALRREVHEAGLLDAYRALYAPSGSGREVEAPAAPPGVNDPL
jgi:hypothetical protein